MSEETANKQEMPEQLSDILLVLDKEKMKIQAVKSIDENGKMETVDPTKKNQNQWKGRNSQNAVCVFDKQNPRFGCQVPVNFHPVQNFLTDVFV